MGRLEHLQMCEIFISDEPVTGLKVEDPSAVES